MIEVVSTAEIIKNYVLLEQLTPSPTGVMCFIDMFLA
jgi:hypothetical protein